MNSAATVNDSHESSAETRRDFLYLSAGAMAAVGTSAALWPLIDSMNLAADILALSTISADIRKGCSFGDQRCRASIGRKA